MPLILVVVTSSHGLAQNPETARTAAGQNGATAEIRDVSPDELDKLSQSASYTQVDPEILNELLRRYAIAQQPNESPIHRAEYTATLSDGVLTAGTLKLEVAAPTSRTHPGILLGKTNLSELQLFSDNGRLTLAADADGNLLPLTTLSSTKITGTWTATGGQSGLATVFQLRFPEAAIAIFRLHTDSSTTVTSANAQVHPESRTQSGTDWIIYPRNPSALTITCTTGDDYSAQSDVTMAATTSVNISSQSTDIQWEVTVPQRLSQSEVTFSLSRPCEIEAVAAGSVPCTWKVNQTATRIQVDLPDLASSTTVRISGSIRQHDGEVIRLPFLQPESWLSTFGELGGRALVRFGSFRVNITSELLVKDIQLDGLLEDDIAVTPSGLQTLEFSQFSRNASATILLTKANPVISDDVIIKLGTGESSDTATAFILVRPVAGTVGELNWNIPSFWRVTDVRELNSNIPLLYRMGNTQAGTNSAEVEVILKSPLSTNSNIVIAAKLQSTERGAAIATQLPTLVNHRYHRNTDLLCLPKAESALLADILNRSMTPADASPDQSWLPDSLQDSVEFFHRSNLTDSGQPDDILQHELYAKISYTAEESTNGILQVIQLDLTSSGPIPRSIPVHVTGNAGISVRPQSDGSASPTIRRVSANGPFDNWLLEFPDELSTTDVKVTLIAPHSGQATKPATLLAVPNAKITGGTIHPIAGSNRSLRNHQGPLTEVQPYPENPFEEDWEITARPSAETDLTVDGSAYAILKHQGGELTAEIMQRVAIDVNGSQRQLNCQLPEAEDLRVFVQDDPVHAAPGASLLTIPLPESVSQTIVTFLWTTRLSNDEFNELQLVIFPEAIARDTQCFVLPPHGYSIDSTTGTNFTANEIAPLLSDRLQRTEAQDSDVNLAAFISRWELASGNASSICGLLAGTDSPGYRLRSSQFDATRKLVWTIFVILIWQCIRSESRAARWLPALVLVTLPFIPEQVLTLPTEVSFGLLCGTGVAAAMRLLSKPVAQLPAAKAQVTGKAALTATVFILGLSVADSYGQNSDHLEKILRSRAADGSTELIHVESNFLKTLISAASPTSGDAAVVSSDVHIILESEQSCLMKFQCLVACDPAIESQLTIPLDNITLVDSSLDGIKVFPERTTDNTARLKIPTSAQVSMRTLKPEQELTFSAGPGSFGPWKIHTVEYTTRSVPSRTLDTFRIFATHPPSAKSSIRFEDRSGIVEAAALSAQPDSARSLNANKCSFPAIVNAQVADLTLNLATDETSLVNKAQRTTVVCVADLSPATQRITCEYRIQQADESSGKVYVGMAPNYRITQIESVTGDALDWAIQDQNLVVEITPDEESSQSFVVQLLFEPATSLQQSVPVAVFSNVNGRRADVVALVADPADRFVVDSVKFGNTLLQESPITTEIRRFSSIRGSEEMIVIPQAADSVEINLAKGQSTRVAELTQKVVVTDSRIRWTGSFLIDVSGQPVFRQSIGLSEELKVTNVQARSNNVSILQSWTRDRDQIVVSLREATRRLLELEIQGDLPRKPDRDTQLPVVSLPSSLQITESELELSASSEADTFIQDAGATQPSSNIDTSRDPIPSTPVRFSVEDETRPLTIRGNPDRFVTARVVVFIHNVNGETRLAQFLNLATPGSGFDIRFRCPQNEFADVSPVFIRGEDVTTADSSGRGFVIPRNSSAIETVLAFADIAPEASPTAMTCRIPDFEARLQIESCEVYDLRPKAQSIRTVKTPAWAAAAAAYTGVVQNAAAATAVNNTFSSASRMIQMEPQITTTAPAPRILADNLRRVYGQHIIQFTGGRQTPGRSGFLIFQSGRSPVTLNIPARSRLTQAFLNGKQLVIKRRKNQLELSLPGKVGFLSLSWLYDDAEVERTGPHSLPLPRFSTAQSEVLAVVAAPVQKPFRWSVVSPSVRVSQARSLRSAAIRNGLSMLNVAVPETREETTVQEQADALLTSLATESPGAAQAATEFFAGCDVRAARGDLLTEVDNTQSIQTDVLRLPPASRTIPVLAGLCFLLATWYTGRVRQPEHSDVPVTRGRKTASRSS